IANTPRKQVVYNTTKAGVIHMTRTLAGEWAPHGIRVNSSRRRYTRTQLVDDLLATPTRQEMLPKWLALTPLGRMAEVTDLQGAVVYLAAEACDYMAGHDMVIDGGYCVWCSASLPHSPAAHAAHRPAHRWRVLFLAA